MARQNSLSTLDFSRDFWEFKSRVQHHKSVSLREGCKKNSCKKSGLLPLAPLYVLPIARVSKVLNRNLHHHQDPNFCVCHHYLQYCFNLFAERERFSNGLVECCVFSGSLVICFYSYSRKFLFLLSKNMNLWFLFLLSKSEIRISHFSFYSRNWRSESHISLSTLEIRDHNFKFLFLLSKFEIRISNFSFYSRIYFFDSRQCLE